MGLFALAEGTARAHGGDLPTGTSSKEQTNPLRGSTLTVDQSITTQTADVGATPQTYAPFYSLFVTLRPRYWLTDHWVVRGRFDYTKQIATNNQQTQDYATTKNYADVFGDVWTDLVYTTELGSWPGTKLSVGPRALWPTSQLAQAAGMYVTLGAIADASHSFALNGPDARTFNSINLRAAAFYLHPFTAATTATNYGGFAYTREDADAHSFISDQIGGGLLPAHEVVGTLEADLQVTPKLSAIADFILFNKWHYGVTGPGCVATLTGCATIAYSPDHPFEQSTWLILQASYALLDEMDLSVGYYSLANAIAPDGQRRGLWGTDNIWWSPDARFFVDVTANLDALFDDAAHHKYSQQGRASPAERGRF
jgi:hypothetical protein